MPGMKVPEVTLQPLPAGDRNQSDLAPFSPRRFSSRSPSMAERGALCADPRLLFMSHREAGSQFFSAVLERPTWHHCEAIALATTSLFQWCTNEEVRRPWLPWPSVAQSPAVGSLSTECKLPETQLYLLLSCTLMDPCKSPLLML